MMEFNKINYTVWERDRLSFFCREDVIKIGPDNPNNLPFIISDVDDNYVYLINPWYTNIVNPLIKNKKVLMILNNDSKIGEPSNIIEDIEGSIYRKLELRKLKSLDIVLVKNQEFTNKNAKGFDIQYWGTEYIYDGSGYECRRLSIDSIKIIVNHGKQKEDIKDLKHLFWKVNYRNHFINTYFGEYENIDITLSNISNLGFVLAMPSSNVWAIQNNLEVITRNVTDAPDNLKGMIFIKIQDFDLLRTAENCNFYYQKLDEKIEIYYVEDILKKKDEDDLARQELPYLKCKKMTVNPEKGLPPRVNLREYISNFFYPNWVEEIYWSLFNKEVKKTLLKENDFEIQISYNNFNNSNTVDSTDNFIDVVVKLLNWEHLPEELYFYGSFNKENNEWIKKDDRFRLYNNKTDDYTPDNVLLKTFTKRFNSDLFEQDDEFKIYCVSSNNNEVFKPSYNLKFPDEIKKFLKSNSTITIERRKVIIPIAAEIKVEKLNSEYTDFSKNIPGKTGSKIEVYEIKTYQDGRREERKLREEEVIESIPNIKQIGTKQINWTKICEDIEEDKEIKVQIELSEDMYTDEADIVIDEGSLGKTIHVITEYYQKDDKQSEEETDTRRIEGKPRRIKRGTKKGTYLWQRLRVKFIDDKTEYKDCKYIPDKEIQNDLSVIRTEHESFREQTNKEIKEFVKKTDYDLNNNKLDEKIYQISRTAEQTKESISSVQSGLKQEIVKTASEYKRDIQNVKEGLSSEFKQTQDSFELSFNRKLDNKLNTSDAESTFKGMRLTPDQIEQVSGKITLRALGGITSSEATSIAKQNAGISRTEAERIAESKKPSSYDIQNEAKRAFSSFKLTPTQINSITRNFKVAADNIHLEGYITNNGGFAVDRNGDVTMRDATIRNGKFEGDIIGNSKIKLGQNGFMRPSGNGLMIAAPASYSANYGMGMQLLGSQDGNAPSGLFLYETDNINSGGKRSISQKTVLTVWGANRMAFMFGQKWVKEGIAVCTNAYKDSEVRFSNMSMWRISFIGYGDSGGGLYFDDGTAGKTHGWWVNPDTSQSDIRLKKNIKPAETRACEIVTKFEFKEFDWKKDRFGYEKPHTTIGLVADDVINIMPELVIEQPGEEKIKNIDDFRLTHVTTKAVQELIEENKKLKGEIAEIKQILKEITNAKNNINTN